MGNLKAYQFWYKSSDTATTEYIYIVAFSRKQACMYFSKYGYTLMYDFDYYPIDELELSGLVKYACGRVLGQYAVL